MTNLSKVLLLALMMFVSVNIMADQKRKLVLELFNITHAKENHQKLINTFIQQFSTNPDLNNQLFTDYFNEAMSWDSLLEPSIQLYMDSYTSEELGALVDFYKSPPGQSFIRKSPEVTEKSAKIVYKNIDKALKNFKKSLQSRKNATDSK